MIIRAEAHNHKDLNRVQTTLVTPSRNNIGVASTLCGRGVKPQYLWGHDVLAEGSNSYY